MLTRQAILTPPEPVHIDTFTEKLRERHRRVRSEGVVWAEAEPEPFRILGLHWLVFVVPALLAAFLMMVDPLGRL